MIQALVYQAMPVQAGKKTPCPSVQLTPAGIARRLEEGVEARLCEMVFGGQEEPG
jgi:hypothetical protein